MTFQKKGGLVKGAGILLLFLMTSIRVWGASCGPHTFTDPQNLKLSGDSVMIVTHPSTQWDGRFSSKLGMDAAVRYAKQQKIPVIYLEDPATENNSSYFFSDCSPNYWISSNGGEFSFNVPVTHVYSVGGHWEYCQATTMNDLLSNWSTKSQQNYTITEIMDGIYSDGSNVSASDSYFTTFKTFMDVINYGRPSSWPFPKLNLLETMGVIKNETQQVDYLTRRLPPYQSYLQGHQVDLYLNGKKEKTVQAGKGNTPLVLKIEFVNSVYVDGDPIPSIPK